MFNKVKVLVIGPCESGKTVLSNFLADATESTGEYRLTQGVRILEFEVDGVGLGGSHSVDIEVELWDCSGDQKFEICWPCIQKNTNGIIFVYNPNIKAHEKQLENWYLHFGKGMKDKQCIVFAHEKPNTGSQGRSKLGGSLARINAINTNLEEDPDFVRDEFKKYLTNVVTHLNERRDQEELSIIE